MSYVVVHNGTPVAQAGTENQAKSFAHNNSGAHVSRSSTEWSETGKLLVGGRWSGWEVVKVRSLINA